MASEDVAVVSDVEAAPQDHDIPRAQTTRIRTLPTAAMFVRDASRPEFVVNPFAPNGLPAGQGSSSAGITTAPAYIPMQMPGVIESAFAQSAAFAAPMMYHPTLAATYYPTGAPQPSPTPCTFLTAGPPITAVCHCVYAQPCALHHRPVSYTPHSFPTITNTGAPAGIPPQSHSHALPVPPHMPPVQIPSLPPTLPPPPLRSAAMRMKRPALHTPNSVPQSDSENSGQMRPPKLRRVSSTDGEPSTSFATHTASQGEEESTASRGNTAGSSVCCDCRTRACAPCTCHQHCPQHSSCTCTRSSTTSVRRENDINPMHDLLLSSRMAQLERERQANNAWFHRQPFAASGLVGVDVVTRRIAPHPFVMLPRYHHPFMELSMVLLQPHETTVVVGGAAPPATEPLPIGASLEQIQRFSTMHKYVKEGDVPENEQERCTVCLMDFETDEEVRSLRCAHVFHVGCIDRWLLYNKKCPVCRLDLDKSELVSN